MITTSDRVAKWLIDHPFHASFMNSGLINSSALARAIKPNLEEQAGERLSVDAITLAINRTKHLQTPITTIDFEQYIGEVSVQSGLSILTLQQVDLDQDAFFAAVQQLQKKQEYTLYTHGVWHTALVGRQDVIAELATHFPNGIITNDLVALTIKLKSGHLPTPGVCAYILQKIAFAGVNLEEVASSYNELTVIVGKDAAKKALDCLV